MTWAFPHIKPAISYVQYIEKKTVRPIHDPLIQQQNFQYTHSLSSNCKTSIKNCLSSEPSNKNKESCFNVDHWKPPESHSQAREEQEQGKETIRAVVAGVVNKYFQIPGKKEMNELELQYLQILANRQKIFKLDVLRCEERTKEIKTKSLQNKILELQRKDIENQSLEASTKALPSVIKQAVKALSKGGVTPQIAQEHISVCTLIAIPSPMVPLRGDKNRIKAHLRWLLVDKLFQIEETCEREIQYKEKTDNLNIDGTVNLSYTIGKLNHASRATDHIFEELQTPVETGILHCQAPEWQEELEAGVERTAKKVAASIIAERWKDKTSRKMKRENKMKLRLKIKKEDLPQQSVQTDMFEVD
jgi:hypothetical protein